LNNPKKENMNRVGVVVFHDASLHIWEDFDCQGHHERNEWSSVFKAQVFKRVIQQLHRLGWKTTVPEDMIKSYGRAFAENYRRCVKGDLQAELRISGRTIDLKMWQDIANIGRKDGCGQYEFDKEKRMPYLIRLEMQRTRNRIRNYLCNVFEGYTFKEPKKSMGPQGLTAAEWIGSETKECCHYKPELGRRGGEEHSYNNRSAEGDIVKHGARVYFANHHGQMETGVAYYNINSMWWVITGRYSMRNISSYSIYTKNPGNLRTKRNTSQRRARLEGELSNAIKVMNFERAGLIRDLLFPNDKDLFVVRHAESGTYHRPGFRGYTHNLIEAGKFTKDEVVHCKDKLNQVIPLVEA
jgi:hypothetical protein